MGHSNIMTLQNNKLIPTERETRGKSQKFHSHQVREKQMQEGNKINQVTGVWNEIFLLLYWRKKLKQLLHCYAQNFKIT